MNAKHTNDDQPAGITAAGVDAAKDVVGLAAKVMDEILAGLEKVTHHGNNLAGAGVHAAGKAVTAGKRGGSKQHGRSPKHGDADDATASGDAGAAHGSLVDTQVVSQLFELAQEVLKVAGDAAGRILQTGLGPVEKMLDVDSHRHDDVRVDVGKVQAGSHRTATFQLENTATREHVVTLDLRNPLASMNDTIAKQHVHLSPRKVHLPAATDDGPGCVDVEVEVDVPSDAKRGHYLGIVRCAEVADLTIVLSVDVA